MALVKVCQNFYIVTTTNDLFMVAFLCTFRVSHIEQRKLGNPNKMLKF